MPKPTEDLTFAESAAASDVTQPDASYRLAGYPAGLKLPNDYHNWLLRAVGRWINWLAGSPIRYTDLEAAIDDMSVGDLAVVDEYDLDSQPGSTQNSDTGPLYDIGWIAADGEGASFASNGAANGQRADRDSQQVAQTFVKTQSGNTHRIISDARYTVIAYGQYVECFDNSDNSSLWDYDHGADVWDIAIDGLRVYLVGDLGTGNEHARAITISSGAVLWNLRHSGTGGHSLQSVCTDGVRVYVGGSVSSYASGATVRALNAANGHAATTEGGATADTAGLAWNIVTNVAVVGNGYDAGKRMATDGRNLWIGFGLTDGGVYYLKRYGVALGEEITSKSFGAVEIKKIAIDRDFVFLITTNGSAQSVLYALRKSDLSSVWTWKHVVAGADEEIFDVSSDHFRVFVACEYFSLADPNLVVLNRGNRPTLVRKVDRADRFLPYSSRILPVEEW